MLTLYYFPEATCGMKARLALDEKQLRYTHRVLDRDAGELTSPEYLKLNPAAVVPTLVHDDVVLVESSIILNYIADAFAGPDLRPPEPVLRARMNLWLKLADESYLPSLGFITYATLLREKHLSKTKEEREATYASIRDSDRRRRRREAIECGLQSPEASLHVQCLDGLLQRADGMLAQTRYLAGNNYSLADCAIIPFVHRLTLMNFPVLTNTHRPHLQRWYEDISQRHSYVDTIGAVDFSSMGSQLKIDWGSSRLLRTVAQQL